MTTVDVFCKLWLFCSPSGKADICLSGQGSRLWSGRRGSWPAIAKYIKYCICLYTVKPALFKNTRKKQAMWIHLTEKNSTVNNYTVKKWAL